MINKEIKAGCAYFEHGFHIEMTLEQAESAAHQGQCDEDVKELSKLPAIALQLDGIKPDDIRAELKEYGAWDKDELADDEQNRQRILWIAASNIREESRQ